MEKNNIKEDQIKSEVEETEVQTSRVETTLDEVEAKAKNGREENTNSEIKKLINGENNDIDKNKNSCIKAILANILDQVLLVAVSGVLVLLCDVVLKLFGYMFVKGTGAVAIAAGIIYLILNCIYAPIMENSKAKNTIAKKILNIK